MFALAKLPEPQNLLGADFLVMHGLSLDLTNKLICQKVVKDLGKEHFVVPELHAVAAVYTSLL